ncbi:Protein of uncharacterised function (DUF2794) [Pannonibacter phragmitetus]|uniref:Protein of uncharacterized function (DUF2794) n=1 Tax=Pannonibacter phragmitetus TaxID=121719 RepID=A0A378ZZW9_9HYPH|nr:DUF2794 domain-containing protein [Pannonibacter phragmitetus]SUB02784.1 Protein of uncharacterised function (DUF2794) [Pannonibacter phragmitetus]
MSESEADAAGQPQGVPHEMSVRPDSPPGSSAQSAVPQIPAKPVVAFDRRELDQILRIYGRMVADGEWRDYAIDLMKDRAVFSVFRRSSEMPLYRIEKDPKLARRQGAYSVVATGGMVLKRGPELASVLKVFEKKRHLRLVDA